MASASGIQNTNDTQNEVPEPSKHGSFSSEPSQEIKEASEDDNGDDSSSDSEFKSIEGSQTAYEDDNGDYSSSDFEFKNIGGAHGLKKIFDAPVHLAGKIFGAGLAGVKKIFDDGLTKEGTELDVDSEAKWWSTYIFQSFSNNELILQESKRETCYMPIYEATIRGDWSAVKRLLKADPEAVKANIIGKETILQFAVRTGRSIPFVQELVDFMPKESLAIEDCDKDTALHYAAIAGNTKAAKILVEKDPTLTQLRNKDENTPLHYAAIYGHRETIRYLLPVTQDGDRRTFAGESGARLLNSIINANFYDIALDILDRYPMLALEKDPKGNRALLILAKKPEAFPSGSNPTIYEHFLTTFAAAFNRRQNVITPGDEENQGGSLKGFPNESKLYRFLERIHSKTLMHKQALQLLRILTSEAVKLSDKEAAELLESAIRSAARSGIPEFVTEVIKIRPYSIWSYDSTDKSIFHLAILHRQEKVFSLLLRTSSYNHFVTQLTDKDRNNVLHLAAKLAPSSRISGAALQMQRELQWFKEVEKLVQPSYKEMENNDGKTPRELFTDEHKNLLNQGEKWMKGTAGSCALVAALVLTVVFAANYTAPGGNDQTTGFPIFLNRASFMTFAVANALALFSSSTSLLTFLGILTSRYSEEDFLRALPMRLSIGLITLFFSIAAMLTAFSTSLHIVLSHKVSWIGVPIGVGACVPVTLFALLQFSLLVQIVSSTFGPSIFRKQGEEIII